MKFIKFYSVASAALIAVCMVQRAVWLSSPNETTHSIGYALTVFKVLWWMVSIFAAVQFKREGMSVVLPLAWIGYQILIIVSGMVLQSVLASNGTLHTVHTALMFVIDGVFVAVFAMLANRLRKRPEKSDT
jgi:hypothetical protein